MVCTVIYLCVWLLRIENGGCDVENLPIFWGNLSLMIIKHQWILLSLCSFIFLLFFFCFFLFVFWLYFSPEDFLFRFYFNRCFPEHWNDDIECGNHDVDLLNQTTIIWSMLLSFSFLFFLVFHRWSFSLKYFSSWKIVFDAEIFVGKEGKCEKPGVLSI